MVAGGNGIVQDFLLALSALFSIVNPIGGAFIFSQVTADRTHAQRAMLAGQIGIYSALLIVGALWIGSYILNFFGISLAALRISGGLVVAIKAWDLLSAPEQNEARKRQEADDCVGVSDIAFFPLTMPLTTGPGTISVAVALGANRPPEGAQLFQFFLGTSGAALVMALVIFLCYRWADRIVLLLGRSRSQIVTRLSAFLLLCVGCQIIINGIVDLSPLLHAAPPK